MPNTAHATLHEALQHATFIVLAGNWYRLEAYDPNSKEGFYSDEETGEKYTFDLSDLIQYQDVIELHQLVPATWERLQ